jgi:type IV secretion system protein VirD4
MASTKVLWGQIAIVFAVVPITMWTATQWVASKLPFQP